VSNTATLTRPVYQPAESESQTRRFPSNGKWFVLGALFVVGVALGWGATRLLPGSSAQRISASEYTAVVAQLFQLDHNTGIARERLALIGSPTDLAAEAARSAQAGTLVLPGDRSAIDALVGALNGTPVATGNGSDTIPTATSDTLPTAQPTSERTSWLGPVLAFILAFSLGLVVLLRTAGLSFGFLRMPWLARFVGVKERLSRIRGSALPGRWDPGAPRHAGVSISEARLDDDDDDADFGDDASEPALSPVPHTFSRAPSRASRKNGSTTYQSVYRMGDDPFDEVHPISDQASGGLVAACGLSAALKFDHQRAGGYYAFTAWVQDYGNSEDLHAAGLVAPGAPDAARGQIENWVRSGQIDTVLSLEPGATTLIGSPDLAATITIVDIEFGLSGEVEDSYVTGMTVKFEVVRRGEHAVASRDLAHSHR
jgi:hypothetical protein